jgi:predicted transcriptional regulator
LSASVTSLFGKTTKEALTVLIATQLVFAHHLQHGPSFPLVKVLPFQVDKQRLLFSQLSFTFNYVSFHSAQLRHNGFSVHYVTAATRKFVNYISR